MLARARRLHHNPCMDFPQLPAKASHGPRNFPTLRARLAVWLIVGALGGTAVETIAQVAVEAAQLLPNTRLGASPPTKVWRGASPARVKISSPRTAVVNADHFTPSALQSKYMNDAEQFAKANGCSAPVAQMNFAAFGVDNFETFAVACESERSMSVRCDNGQCRAM